MTSKGSRYFRC